MEQVTLIEIESKSINEANIIICVLFTQCDFFPLSKVQRMSSNMMRKKSDDKKYVTHIQTNILKYARKKHIHKINKH